MLQGLIVPSQYPSALDELFFRDGEIQCVSKEALSHFQREELLSFMYHHALYVLPVIELAEELRQHFKGKVIEVGSGNGAIAKHLQIPATDSFLQNDPTISKLYGLARQPTVVYGKNVKHYTAYNAVRGMRPDTVLACYVTQKYDPAIQYGSMYGVDEIELLHKVRRYIKVGNDSVHGVSAIFKKPHTLIRSENLFCRAKDQFLNHIAIFDNQQLNSK